MESPEEHPQSVHDHYFGHEQVAIIEPQKGWRLVDWKELWAYRELLYVLTTRDIKVRYKQTVLGFAWAIIQRVMMMLVFSFFLAGSRKCHQMDILTRSSSMLRCC